MTERGKDRSAPPAVGGISLLVVFAVLCLTVFALLSLSTVRADDRLGKLSAQAVADYYEADTRAEEILAKLRAGQISDEVIVDGDLYSYTCPISDTQELQVQVRLEEDAYTILCWQAVPVGEWVVDDSIHVWEGE